MTPILRKFRAELHIHTVLSPCAEVEMIPPLIIQQALEKNISIIAITDHNATANIKSVQEAAHGSGLLVLPGMELQTIEEVHCLCLFETLQQIDLFQSFITNHLPHVKNNPEYFGEQFVVDKTGDFLRREEQLLIVSANVTLNNAFNKVNELGGLFIPAHVDRKAFGLINNLGFIPEDIQIPAVEISRNLKVSDIPASFPQIIGYPLLQGGDAHRLDEILGANEFYLDSPSFVEIKKALSSENGRHVQILI